MGATQGIGHALAGEYARRGNEVIITGRTAERATAEAARLDAETEGFVSGLALDLSRPDSVADALSTVGRVDRLAVAGMIRDNNTVASFGVPEAVTLATTKIVGYAAVAAVLKDRLTPDAAVLLFGGMAKDRPYPGSTVLSTVNAAMVGLVRTLSVELAPVRVNSIHPGAVADSPAWVDKQAALEPARKISLTGALPTVQDIVDGCLFLLENAAANGVNLTLDAGQA
ncbi:SDR family oxidoreductase [Catellatospora citrea]|uniref:Short-chain dehydrogenase n=1 Tax=Catellatospora citrea TaxID=53366 RepID=A0A8J3KTZ2_9ACTN|nr:SDR family oxidoreductase [Catellatospora citrea]GIG03141.1 short-chain dehydrogenase [Catellatospora citrea]